MNVSGTYRRDGSRNLIVGARADHDNAATVRFVINDPDASIPDGAPVYTANAAIAEAAGVTVGGLSEVGGLTIVDTDHVLIDGALYRIGAYENRHALWELTAGV